MKLRRIILSTILAIILCTAVSAADFPKARTYSGNFSDISGGEWYASDVKNSYELGLMSGDTSGKFNPSGNITVAEAVTVAARAVAISRGEIIPQTAGVWYQMYADYAINAGVIAADTFKSDEYARVAKRHEVASLFAKILPEAEYTAINSVESIPDVTPARTYSKDVLKLYKAGIVMGSDAQGTFYPESNITRAEIAAIVNRAAISGNRIKKELDKVSEDDAYLLVTNRSFDSEKEGINSGWLLDNRGGTPRTSYDAVYGALFDIDKNAGTAYIREVNKIDTGIITLETTAKISGYDGVAVEFCDQNENPVYKLVTVDGNWHILTDDGITKKIFDITPNALNFTFKISVDLDNKRSTTYINGKNCGTYPLSVKDTPNVMSLRFTTDKEHTSVISPGAVTAYVNYPVYGNITAKAGQKTEHIFMPLGGKKVISEFLIMVTKEDKTSYRVMSEDKTALTFTTDANGFYVNGECVYEDYYTTMYYRIRLEMDMDTQTAVIKLNGRKVKEVPFADAVTSVSRIVFESQNDNTLIRCKTFREIEHDDYVPVPVVPKGEEKYTVGLNVCSLWTNGYAPQGGWSIITPFDDRQPVLGYYDEGNPETADWEIKYLLEHGVDFQAFCVFFGSNAHAKDLEAFHLYDGFMNAKYSDMTKFAVIWEALGGEAPADMGVWKVHYVPYMIENFFKDPRYMTIDNKPVFIVYGHSKLQNSFGSNEAVKEALTYLEEEVKKLGFDGLIKLASATESSPAYTEMGFDGVYAYNWGEAGNALQINTSYMEKSAKVKDSAYTVPSVSVGFNSIPWDGIRRGMMSKTDYAKAHEFVKNEFLPTYAKQDWQKNFVMLSNWNEYGEGTFIMPTTDEKGFGYLDVLREAYTDEKADASINIVPTNAQKERITHLYPQYRRMLKKQGYEKEEINTAELESIGKVGPEAYAYVLGIENLKVSGAEGVVGRSSTNDPVIMLQNVKGDYDLDQVVAIAVTLQVPKDSNVEIFYKTSAENNWSQSRTFNFKSETDKMQTVMLSTSNKAGWTSKCAGFRIDPCTEAGVNFTVKDVELFKYNDLIPSKIMNINGNQSLLSFSPYYATGEDIFIPFEPVTGMDFQLDLFHLWDKDNGVLKLSSPKHEIVFTVGSDEYTVDGEKMILDASIDQIDGIPYIPINIICKEFGYEYSLNEKNQICITTPDNDYFIEKEASKVPGRWEFNYAGDTEGWSCPAMSLVVSEGAMNCTSLSNYKDPFIMSTGGMSLDTSKYKTLEIRVRYKYESDNPIDTQLFFVTDKSGNWSEDKSYRMRLKSTDSDGEWEVYTADLTANTNWTGNIRQLRFDPFNAVGTMEVDYIRLIEE